MDRSTDMNDMMKLAVFICGTDIGVQCDWEVSCLKANNIDHYNADLCKSIKKVLWNVIILMQKVAGAVTDRLDYQVYPEIIVALLHVSPIT